MFSVNFPNSDFNNNYIDSVKITVAIVVISSIYYQHLLAEELY